MIGDGLTFRRFLPDQLIAEILAQLYIAEEADLKSTIATVRNQILEFFGSDNFDRKYIIYLENIDFDSDKIELEDHVIISSLSQHYKLQLLNTVPAFANIYGFSGPSWQRIVPQEKMTSIESRYAVRKYIKHDDEDFSKPPQPDHGIKVRDRIFRLLNSIRILSDKTVIHSPLFHFDYNTPFRPQVGSGLYEYTNRLTSRFCFDLQKIDTLRKLYSSIEKIENRHLSVRIGLGRLGKIGTRDSLEDMVLDLFIGFEAIVLGGIGRIDPIQSELRFRLAALTAKYLGKDASEQKKLYKQLLDGYDLRSAIAHGSRNSEIKSHELEELRKVYHRLLYKWINDLEHGNRPDTPTLLFS
jgi:hypothetical protein